MAESKAAKAPKKTGNTKPQAAKPGQESPKDRAVSAQGEIVSHSAESMQDAYEQLMGNLLKDSKATLEAIRMQFIGEIVHYHGNKQDDHAEKGGAGGILPAVVNAVTDDGRFHLRIFHVDTDGTEHTPQRFSVRNAVEADENESYWSFR